MTDARPDPEHLLASAQAEEARRGRGELRVYVGMCPGVGKTYTMLQEAGRIAQSGHAVLAGIIETHGRDDTAALLEGLETVPRRAVEHRGTVLHEFDLDAALGRRPQLVLIDELAHTNAPGSRHPKRWQDVNELLESGIDVWTTVNIQHIESLRDSVARITGIRIQETIPDSFFDLADEVRVIDLTPDQLRERLREGKVYLGERAQTAADNFFREGNLSALREMALRFTAQRVDRELRDYMRRHLIAGPWRSGERLLVAVGSSPFSERLIRLARRQAGSLHASWIAVHVETGAPVDDDERARLAAHLALARSLGADVVSIAGDDTGAAILEVARRENVTQIIAGKPLRLPWWRRLFGRSIADRLARESGEIDLVLVHPADPRERAAPVAPPAAATPGVAAARDFGVAAAALAATTVLGLLGETWVGYRSVPMLYLLAITVSGLLLHRWAVLALAAASSLTWNFFFTDPRYTLRMLEREDTFLLVAFLAVAFVLGHLTTRLRRREQASREGEERAQALYQLTRVIAASIDFTQAAGKALDQIATAFSAEATLLVAPSPRELEVAVGPPLDQRALSVCHWVADHRQAGGRFTHTLPEAEILALPLIAGERAIAVLAMRPHDDSLRSPLRRDLLDAFAAHLTVLVEKEDMQRGVRDARLAAASQRLQRALLDQVSHELKTPAAVIQAAAERLSGATGDDPSLIAEIRQATSRLNRVVTQLVTLSRVEAGLIRPNLEVCDARDLLDEVIGDLGPARQQVQVICDEFEFRTDAMLLHTAIGNLVLNAVQHSPSGSTVRVQARRNAAGAGCIEVTNTGNSIPPAERSRIFERFARGSDARPGGMGLGLSIARHFVEAVGGRLELADEVPEETTFRITLPVDAIPSPAIPPTHP
ncbi:MAG: sensor histidine kinase KdpD [Opitutaceae bacterium]|nr:sensor histidine kinase KdpD [Opitutaceae bacterium]